MNDDTTGFFRAIASQMDRAPHDWQWIGQYMSQRHFGITEARAKTFEARHGGKAEQMAKGGR